MSGKVRNELDQTRRLSIPAGWRPEPGEKLWLLETKNGTHLQVLTLTDLERRLEDIRNVKDSETGEDVDPAIKRELEGNFFGDCRETSINEQGKLQVPKDCQEAVGLPLGGEVVLVGRGQWFEIWAVEQITDFKSEHAAKVAALEAKLGTRG